MVEIMFEDNNWGATPRVFYSEAEANAEIALLKLKYPFISKCRVVTRKEKEKDYPHRGAKTMDMIEEIKETLTMEVRPNSKDFEYLEVAINRKDLELLNSLLKKYLGPAAKESGKEVTLPKVIQELVSYLFSILLSSLLCFSINLKLRAPQTRQNSISSATGFPLEKTASNW